MKTDNQHLEYLISQYVDGCLDGASRKSLEQKLVNDPTARQLYKEQRDVQDVLDDWGSRIPMINWSDFDKKLATRLEHEVVGGGKISIFRRWARPMSAAAALFIAASVGYAWHAWSVNPVSTGTGPIAEVPAGPVGTPVVIDGMDPSPTASAQRVTIDDAPMGLSVPLRGNVAIVAPEDVEASKALRHALTYGMEGLPASVDKIASPNTNNSGAVSASAWPGPSQKKDVVAEKEPGPAFP